MALALLLLESRISQTLELILSSHKLPPKDKELFATLGEQKKRLQDHVFTQGFALAISSFQKGKTVLVLDYTQHGKKTRNYQKSQMKIKLGLVIRFYLKIVDTAYVWDIKKGDGNWLFLMINIQAINLLFL